MTEKDEQYQPDPILEQRLAAHYASQYAPLRPAERLWEQLAAQLDQPEAPQEIAYARRQSALAQSERSSAVLDIKKGRFGLRPALLAGLAAMIVVAVGLLVLVTLDSPNDAPIGGPVATPTATNSPDSPTLPGVQPVTLSPALAKSLISSLPLNGADTAQANLKVYVSDQTVNSLVSNFQDSLSKAGYQNAVLPDALPVASSDQIAYITYIKSGQPDLIVGVVKLPTGDVSQIFRTTPGAPSEINRLVAQVQGHQTIIYEVTAPTLFKSFNSSARLFGPDLHQLNTTKIGQTINLSQTVGSYTLTLERVYADANYVLIGYRLSGSADQHIIGTKARLSDLDNNTGFEPPLDYSFEFSNPQTLPLTWFVFRANILTGSQVRLHLDSGTLYLAHGPLPTAVGGRIVIGSDDKAGPFSFDLTAPLEKSQVVTLNKSGKLGATGATMTLNKVVITPLGARFYLHKEIAKSGDRLIAFTSTDEDKLKLSLQAGGQTYQNFGIQTSNSASDKPDLLEGDLVAEIFQSDLITKKGEWTLNISEGSGAGPLSGLFFPFTV